MYWQKWLNRENPDAKLEETIQEIFEENDGNYGYRRIQIEHYFLFDGLRFRYL